MRVAETISRYPFLWLSLILLATGAAIRRDLGSNVGGLVCLGLVGVYFQLVPRALYTMARRRFAWATPALGAAVCFLVFLLLGVFLGWIGGVLLAIGSAVVLWRARGGGTEQPFGSRLVAWLGVALVACALVAWWVVIVSTGWGSHYLSPTFDEQIWSGTTNRDSTISIVYSMMYQQYGVLSHGIHGLPPFHYHLGAQVFHVAVGNITGQSISFAYNAGFVAVAIPAFLGTLHWILVSSLPASRASTQVAGLVVLTALVVHVVPASLLDGYGLWPSYFLSESYLFGLWLAVMYVACLVAVMRAPHGYAHPLVSALFMAAFLGWTVFTKVSVGFVCACVFGLLFLAQLRKSVRRAPWGLAVLSVIGALVGAWRAYFPDPVSYEWNYFITRYGQGNVVRFYLFHYYHLWLAIAALVVLAWVRKHRALAETPADVPSTHDYVRWTIVAFVVGLPSLHATIAGGSGYYFTNIVMWLAVPAVCIGGMQLYESTAVSPRALAIVGLACVALVMPSVSWHARRIAPVFREARAIARTVDRQMQTPLGKYIAACHRIARTTATDTAVYVAKSETQYFGAFDATTIRQCEVAPFVIAKECSRPVLYGVPPREQVCADSVMVKRWLGDEYSTFPETPTHTDLCREARRYELSRYVTLQWNAATLDIDVIEHACD